MKEGFSIKSINFEYEVVPFCCEHTFTQELFQTLFYIYDKKKYNYSSVAVVCQEWFVETLLKFLCVVTTVDDIDLTINYLDYDPNDYEGEYVVILSIENDILMLSIEKAKHDNNEYKTFEEDYVYISDECSGELILRQTAYEGEMDIFSIGEECEE